MIIIQYSETIPSSSSSSASTNIAVAELQKGKGKSTTPTCDRNKSGGEKRKRECDTCGKRHAVECWKLQSGGGNNGGRKGSNFFTKKDAKQYLKSMFATQGSEGNSDSSDSDEEDSWKSGY